MRMLPEPSCPRAGQSGVWQNWGRAAIDVPHAARCGDHARRDARWTRVFQEVTLGPRFPGVLPPWRLGGSIPRFAFPGPLLVVPGAGPFADRAEGLGPIEGEPSRGGVERD